MSYQYDALKRLSVAVAVNTSNGSAKWNQSYQYDGFSNLIGKTTNGVTVSYPVDPATNRISNGNIGSVGMYDANGNMTGAPGTTLAYDVMNRVSSANVNGAVEQYLYDSANRRTQVTKSNGQKVKILYGARGEKLAYYSVGTDPDTGLQNFAIGGVIVWFQGKMLEGVGQRADRLGSRSRNYMPYGEPKAGTTVPVDTDGFATYTRDSFSGLDYAVNRWSLPGMGRFGSADPYQASAGPGDPGSWNRYAYARNNPVGLVDPLGLWEWNPGYYDWSWFCDATREGCPGGGGNPGGGGGGGDQDGRGGGTSYKQASKDQEQETLSEAANTAFALLENQNCASLFNIGGGNLSPKSVLEDLLGAHQNSELDFGDVGKSARATTVRGDFPDGSIKVYVTLSDDLTNSWYSSPVLRNAQTLIHELGHLYNFLFGENTTLFKQQDNPGVAGGKENQKWNADLILHNCNEPYYPY